MRSRDGANANLLPSPLWGGAGVGVPAVSFPKAPPLPQPRINLSKNNSRHTKRVSQHLGIRESQHAIPATLNPMLAFNIARSSTRCIMNAAIDFNDQPRLVT